MEGERDGGRAGTASFHVLAASVERKSTPLGELVFTRGDDSAGPKGILNTETLIDWRVSILLKHSTEDTKHRQSMEHYSMKTESPSSKFTIYGGNCLYACLKQEK